MPIVRSYVIKNFKGIEEIKIDLIDRTSSPVTTLIGLNESGKTTVLEALSQWISGDKSVSELFEGIHAKSSGTALIPIHRKAAFTGDIEIIGNVQLTDDDIQKINKIAAAQKPKLVINVESLQKPFNVSILFRFEDSNLKKSLNSWGFDLQVRTERGTKFSVPGAASEIWRTVQKQIKQDMPQIVYFPTFLVDMPNRIYLEEHEDESATNRHYRQVFQDILDSQNAWLSLQKHVCSRIDEFHENEKSPNGIRFLSEAQAKD